MGNVAILRMYYVDFTEERPEPTMVTDIDPNGEMEGDGWKAFYTKPEAIDFMRRACYPVREGKHTHENYRINCKSGA